MEIIKMKIEDVVPYENNAKLHPKEQIEQIKKSIQEFGNNDPIAVDENNIIIEGHGRYLALQELGYKEVEVIRLSHMTEEQRKAYTLVHNKLTMNTGFDMELLIDELEDIVDIDMSEYDFEIPEEEEDDPHVEEDDFDPDVKIEERTKPGDVWQLGRHRLMCGDSTSHASISKLTGGQVMDLVFTDPPYGMKKEKDGVMNDNLNYDDLLEFNKEWIPLTFDALKENGSWYCWGIDEPLMDIYVHILKPMMKENKITFRNLLTWDKGSARGQMWDGGRSYVTADEKCLFVMCGVQGFNINSDNYFEGWEPLRSYLNDEMEKCGGRANWKKALGNEMGSHYFTTSQWAFPTKEAYEKLQAFGKEYGAFGKEYGEIKEEYEKIKAEYYSTRAYFNNTHDNMNNVWHFSPASQEERKHTGGHATPKPLVICERAIKSSSREGENVLDVFGGSGSTLIACEQLNRNCFTMELDPKYCDVIINRWENVTGKKAVLVNG